MSSLRQVAANQRNSKLSTGPRTPAGKAAASLNAVTTGLCARTPVLPGEDRAAFLRLREDLFQSWLPENERERFLFEEVVRCSWRVLRLRNVETEMWGRYILAFRESQGAAPVPANEQESHAALAGVLCEMPEQNFRGYFRNERVIMRDFYRSMQELDRAQALRRRLDNSAAASQAARASAPQPVLATAPQTAAAARAETHTATVSGNGNGFVLSTRDVGSDAPAPAAPPAATAS